MAKKTMRFFMRVMPAFFIILVCYKLLDRPAETSPSKLLDTINSLYVSQRDSFFAANVSLDNMDPKPFKVFLNDSRNSTLFNVESDFRSWFDLRPTPNLLAVPGNLSSHPFFQGYVIENPDVCREQKVDVLIYLHSAADHRDRRHAIRQTWASSNNLADVFIKHVFLLGTSTDQGLKLRVKSEASAYGDIIMGDFVDSISNLTYKAVTMMAWVTTHCGHARYIVKVDDDMFVDIFRVVTNLIPSVADKKYALVCDHKQSMPIIRDTKNRWHVPGHILPTYKRFPPFCPGFFMMMTGNLVPIVFEKSFGMKEFVPFDDVYLFGLLVKDVHGLEIVNIHSQISTQSRADPVQELKANGKFEYLSFAAGAAENHVKFWTHRKNKLTTWESRHSSYARDVLDVDRVALVV